MATFVLVHGAFHGAWCWVKLLPELQARGHRAVTLDMPGCGNDQTAPQDIRFDEYVRRIGGALQDLDEKAVLVGHSMGTVLTAAAAERHPDRVRRLVFLGGVIPKDGLSLYELLQVLGDPATPPRSVPPRGDPWHGLAQDPPLDRVREVYYNDCSEADIAYALAHLRPQSNVPRVARVRLTPQRFGSVPRAFIGGAIDNANTPARQRATLAMFPCEHEITLPTSHSPFFSNPGLLAETLASVI